MVPRVLDVLHAAFCSPGESALIVESRGHCRIGRAYKASGRDKNASFHDREPPMTGMESLRARHWKRANTSVVRDNGKRDDVTREVAFISVPTFMGRFDRVSDVLSKWGNWVPEGQKAREAQFWTWHWTCNYEMQCDLAVCDCFKINSGWEGERSDCMWPLARLYYQERFWKDLWSSC